MSGQNIQDNFLSNARRDKVPVTIFLVSGFQLKGIVCGFDNYVVMLDSDGKLQMVYKHAISTILPSKAMKFLDEKEV